MAQPPKYVPPEINSKWLALRQKHQEDSNDFQRAVTKSRVDFDSRGEESEFWSNHEREPAIAKDATPAMDSARLQAPATTKNNITVSRTTAIPLHRISTSPPSTPRMQQLLPTTPLKASQLVDGARAPSAPTKSRSRPAQKQGIHAVIDLCNSDDDDDIPPAKASIVQKHVAQPPIRHEPAIRGIAHQEFQSSEPMQSNATYSVPEATLELFGGNTTKRSVGHTLMVN
jgi:hypothetical protein